MQRKIPQYVDEPVHFLLWSADEIAPIGLGLFAGILAGSPGIFLLFGFAGAYVYRKFKEVSADGFALHYLYWVGVMPMSSRTAPNPYSKIFLP